MEASIEGAALPPQNLEAEESVLGAMMVSQAAIDAVLDARLEPDDFYRPRHRTIHAAIRELDGRGEPIDALTVAELLKTEGRLEEVGGPETLASLASSTPAPGNAGHYATIVKQNALMRRLLEAAQRIQTSINAREAEPRELVEQAERLLFSVARADQASEFSRIADVLMEETDRLEKLASGEYEMTGTPSGFRRLDDMTGGFQPGNLIVIAARPAMGKSSLVCNIAENVAWKAKKPVAFFSLEMSETELAHRFIASRAKVSSDKLRKGQVRSDWPKVIKACNELTEAPLWIDDSSDLSLLDLRAKARRLSSTTGGLGLIIVDYIQLLRPEDSRAGRVEQVGQMSRGLKILARELEVPVIGLSQLSRAPEQRPDKVPILSDLRESGCLTGDARVLLADDGTYVPIRDLVAGKAGVGREVMALDPATWKLERRRVTDAFATGRKPVFGLRMRSGRRLRATANHKFLTATGWRRLDQLEPGDHLATPRIAPVDSRATMGGEELALLGHLIGDGCTLPRHAIQYTTRERHLAELVADLARKQFGDELRPRIHRERAWYQVYLPASRRLGRRRRNPIAEWLDGLGVFGLRSHEKRVPVEVFRQPTDGVGRFLRHLWATDGCVWLGGDSSYPAIYYATSSIALARGVQSLLLRLGITATLRQAGSSGRPHFHVSVTGGSDMARFLQGVGAVEGSRAATVDRLIARLEERGENTNRDVVPRAFWHSLVKPAMAEASITARGLQAEIGTSYCGSTLYRSNLSRERAARVATAVGSEELGRLARSDVYWDRIDSIESDGEEEVYDLTVDGLHNFVAEDIVVHNSIEQDADIVSFIFREEYYFKDESERPGEADLIIAKHRNGPIGTVPLAFQEQYPRFLSLSTGADEARHADAA
jgi:replicative DNA helicase